MTSSEKISFTYNQSIDLVTKELENTKIGQDAGTNITGERNIILGKDTAFNCADINDSIIIGYRYGFNLTESSSNLVYIVNNGIGGDERLVSDNNSITIGSLIGNKLIYNNNNNIIGFNCINNIESNISNNVIHGSYIGNELISSINNTIVGNYNLNEAINAINTIYIGGYNTSYDLYQSNLIVIGNNNSIKENPIVIGNSNIINTISSISIGNKLESYNVLKAVNYLNTFDPIFNKNIIDSLKLNDLIVKGNYIYQSPHNPTELSLNNNLNYKQIDIRLDTFSNIKLENDMTYMYDVKYTLDERNIYRFIEPTIVYTTFDNNSINFQFNNMNDNFQIYIIKLPTYSYVPKRLYDHNETIVLEQYLEYANIFKDLFTISIVINIEGVSYLSRKSYDIIVNFNNRSNDFNITEIYGNYISLDWFEDTLHIDKRGSELIIDDTVFYMENVSITNSNASWNDETYNFKNTINHIIVNGVNIKINDNNITVNNITDVYDININTEWYMFSSNLFYIGENNIGNFIYIEIPPKYGIINTNLIEIKDDTFISMVYMITQDRDDEMTIRILNNDKTKLSDLFVIKLKNYIVNKIEKLSRSLIDDLYYVENNIILNPNISGVLLEYINNCNINYIDLLINYDTQIDTNINENIITIDIYPFNRVNIYEELIKYGFRNIEESNIFILNENIENGYIDGKDYINSTNINDNIKILIGLNRYNYDIVNEYKIVFNIINNYVFEYTTQYIYDDLDLLKTFKVANHPDNKIFIYDRIEAIKLDNKYIDSNFNNFKVLFGDKIENINLEYYPIINDFEVLQDSYWFKQIFSITEINEEHSIEYIFENGISDFTVGLNVFITLYEQFNIEKFKKYKFAIILNDTEYVYDETSELNYNSNNVITLDNTVDILYNLKIVYKLSENIYSEGENITNYFLKINFSDLSVGYKIDSGTNILYGSDLKCYGYENIGLGSLYNLYGNNSIVIGNKIGKEFINNSIIFGNNSFTNVIPRNLISIGNNNYNDIEDSLLFDEVCSKNPIIIGHNLDFNSNNIININNIIIETDDNIIIGNSDKRLIISNVNIYYKDIKNRPKILSNYNDLDGLPNLDLYIKNQVLHDCNYVSDVKLYDILDNCNYVDETSLYTVLENCNYVKSSDLTSMTITEDLVLKLDYEKIKNPNTITKTITTSTTITDPIVNNLCNLIAWYKFDAVLETNQLKDETGNYNLDYTSTNNIIDSTNSKFDNSMIIDSDDSVVTNTDFPSITATSIRSYSLWVKRNRINSLDFIFNQGPSGNGIYLVFSSNTLVLQIVNNSVASALIASNADGNIIYTPMDEWIHIVAIINNRDTKLFVDGVDVGSKSNTITTIEGKLIIASSAEIHIDEFRIYDKVLSTTEIYNLYTFNTLVPAISLHDYSTYKTLTFTHGGPAATSSEYAVNFPDNTLVNFNNQANNFTLNGNYKITVSQSVLGISKDNNPLLYIYTEPQLVIKYFMRSITTITQEVVPTGYLKFQSEGNTDGYWKVEPEPVRYTDGIFDYPEIFLPKLYRCMYELNKAVVNYQYSFNNTNDWNYILPDATINIASNTAVKLRIITTTLHIINKLGSDTFKFVLSVAQSGVDLGSDIELIYNDNQDIHIIDFTTAPYTAISYDTNINVYLKFKTANYIYDNQEFIMLRTG